MEWRNPAGVAPGQIWKDVDPRGGPTFRVVRVESNRAEIVGLDGKRPRSVLLNRFRVGHGYRSGYELVSTEGDQ